MPKLVWLYLTALLYDRTSATGVALAEALPTVSHDRLTSMLQSDWCGHTRLEIAWRTLFVCDRGFLLIDDTVIPKPFATAIENLAWVYSSQEPKPVSGLSLVLLVWTNGILRIPLGIRLWHTGGPSTYALALELLSGTRHRLRCRPHYVLFDAWYPSRALLKRIRAQGWDFILEEPHEDAMAALADQVPPLLRHLLAIWQTLAEEDREVLVGYGEILRRGDAEIRRSVYDQLLMLRRALRAGGPSSEANETLGEVKA